MRLHLSFLFAPLPQGDLQRMFEVFEFMKVSGRRPGPETCYILVKGCVDQGRPDLAELVIREFEQNGVRCVQPWVGGAALSSSRGTGV